MSKIPKKDTSVSLETIVAQPSKETGEELSVKGLLGKGDEILSAYRNKPDMDARRQGLEKAYDSYAKALKRAQGCEDVAICARKIGDTCSHLTDVYKAIYENTKREKYIKIIKNHICTSLKHFAIAIENSEHRSKEWIVHTESLMSLCFKNSVTWSSKFPERFHRVFCKELLSILPEGKLKCTLANDFLQPQLALARKAAEKGEFRNALQYLHDCQQILSTIQQEQIDESSIIELHQSFENLMSLATSIQAKSSAESLLSSQKASNVFNVALEALDLLHHALDLVEDTDTPLEGSIMCLIGRLFHKNLNKPGRAAYWYTKAAELAYRCSSEDQPAIEWLEECLEYLHVSENEIIMLSRNMPSMMETLKLQTQEKLNKSKAVYMSKNYIGGQYTLLREIGRGAFGIVFLARKAKSGFFAIKCLRSAENDNEIEMAKKISPNKNVIHVLEAFHFPESREAFCVMEYCAEGDLNEYIIKNKLQMEAKLYIMQDIANGVAHLHSNYIMHRDLKPQNVLITVGKGRKIICKITDFGMCKEQQVEKSFFVTQCGTEIFMAPEVLSIGWYKYSADIFSLGLLFYTIVLETTDFYDKSKYLVPLVQNKGMAPVHLKFYITREDFLEVTVKNWMSDVPNLASLIFKMIQSKPDKRISIEEVKTFFNTPQTSM